MQLVNAHLYAQIYCGFMDNVLTGMLADTRPSTKPGRDPAERWPRELTRSVEASWLVYVKKMEWRSRIIGRSRSRRRKNDPRGWKACGQPGENQERLGKDDVKESVLEENS
jgi:hypothetical protein